MRILGTSAWIELKKWNSSIADMEEVLGLTIKEAGKFKSEAGLI